MPKVYVFGAGVDATHGIGPSPYSTRIKKTAKEDLVYLLEHRWQPMPALALA